MEIPTQTSSPMINIFAAIGAFFKTLPFGVAGIVLADVVFKSAIRGGIMLMTPEMVEVTGKLIIVAISSFGGVLISQRKNINEWRRERRRRRKR